MSLRRTYSSVPSPVQRARSPVLKNRRGEPGKSCRYFGAPTNAAAVCFRVAKIFAADDGALDDNLTHDAWRKEPVRVLVIRYP